MDKHLTAQESLNRAGPAEVSPAILRELLCEALGAWQTCEESLYRIRASVHGVCDRVDGSPIDAQATLAGLARDLRAGLDDLSQSLSELESRLG